MIMYIMRNSCVFIAMVIMKIYIKAILTSFSDLDVKNATHHLNYHWQYLFFEYRIFVTFISILFLKASSTGFHITHG